MKTIRFLFNRPFPCYSRQLGQSSETDQVRAAHSSKVRRFFFNFDFADIPGLSRGISVVSAREYHKKQRFKVTSTYPPVVLERNFLIGFVIAHKATKPYNNGDNVLI